MGQKQRVNCVGEPVCVYMCMCAWNASQEAEISQLSGSVTVHLLTETDGGRKWEEIECWGESWTIESTLKEGGCRHPRWIYVWTNSSRVAQHLEQSCETKAEEVQCYISCMLTPILSVTGLLSPERLFKGLEPGQKEILCVSNRMLGWEIKTEMFWSISFT